MKAASEPPEGPPGQQGELFALATPGHSCRFPEAARYPHGVVFSCGGCGRTYALVATWVERPALRQRS